MDLNTNNIKGKGIEVYRKGRELSDKFDTLNQERADAGWFSLMLVAFVLAIVFGVSNNLSYMIGDFEVTKIKAVVTSAIVAFVGHRANLRKVSNA